MKKDRMRELLTELCDREASLTQCVDLFHSIDEFFYARKRWMNSLGSEFEQDAREYLDDTECYLKNIIEDLGLSDYTIDEFITED